MIHIVLNQAWLNRIHLKYVAYKHVHIGWLANGLRWVCVCKRDRENDFIGSHKGFLWFFVNYGKIISFFIFFFNHSITQCQGCIDIHKGIQWRNVECHHQNGTINMDESECYHWNSNKPITQQECYHMNCIPMWKIFNKTIQHSLTEIEKEESFDLNERKVCFSFDL